MLTEKATLRLNAAARALGINISDVILKYVPVIEQRSSTDNESDIHPTIEQSKIIQRYTQGYSCDVDARAGTGKSTTLFWCAEQMNGTGLYVAFNQHTVRDAESKLPKDVETKTINSIAFAHLDRRYKERLVRNIPLQHIVDYYDLRIFEELITQKAAANLIRDSLSKFCNSNDAAIKLKHVDKELLTNFTPKIKQEMLDTVIAFTADIFNEMLDINGTMPITHDFYVKLFSISDVKLKYDFIMVDEAQDWTAAHMSIIDRQEVPVIRVGDVYQNLYSWKASGNSYVKTVKSKKHVFRLTNSFRFGNKIAKEANKILKALDAEDRGLLNEIESVESNQPAYSGTAVICRTVIGAFCEYINGRSNNKYFSIENADIQAIKYYGKGLLQIYNSEQPSHPLLMTHRSWQEFTYWAMNNGEHILREAIRLVDELGPIRLNDYISNIIVEKHEDRLVTVNRCKGLEYESVRISSEFLIEEKETPEFLTQKYVAITRGVKRVDF